MISGSLICVFFFLMIRRPPRSTLFPYRRSSDLRATSSHSGNAVLPPCSFVPRQFHTPKSATVHRPRRSEEHTSELQSRQYLVCRLLLEKKNRARPAFLYCLVSHLTNLPRSLPVS